MTQSATNGRRVLWVNLSVMESVRCLPVEREVAPMAFRIIVSPRKIKARPCLGPECTGTVRGPANVRLCPHCRQEVAQIDPLYGAAAAPAPRGGFRARTGLATMVAGGNGDR